MTILFLPYHFGYISFSCLIAVVRTSNTLLNKSIESGHLCFVSDLKENVFSFSPLSMMLAVGLSYMAFIILRYVPSVSTFWRVFQKFFPHLLRWLTHFFYSSVWLIWFITLIDCRYLNPCNFGRNPTWSWCIILLELDLAC